MDREWRELYAALDCQVVAAIHPFYTATLREFDAAGRQAVGSAPVGYDGTANWLSSIGEAFGVPSKQVAKAQNMFLPSIREALKNNPKVCLNPIETKIATQAASIVINAILFGINFGTI